MPENKVSEPLGKFKRTRIVQEEIVTVARSLVPSAVSTSRGNRQVEKGELIVTHEDGNQEVFTDKEFNKTFVPYVEEPEPDLKKRR